MKSEKIGKKLVVGNWKMYPNSLLEAKKTFATFKKKKINNTGVTTVICPPFVYLHDLSKMYIGNKIFFGAQNVFWKEEGSFTGEISPEMIKNLGARFVIVGHSERRSLGENDELISRKIKTALSKDLHTILCVGEPTRDSQGNYLRFVRDQIKNSLNGVNKNLIKRLIIAYEPIWTIGQGNNAMNFHEIHQMVLFIKKQLIEIYGRKLGENIPILYGGSVDSENANEIIHQGGVNGVLVGRNSLNPHEFAKIVEEVAKKPNSKHQIPNPKN